MTCTSSIYIARGKTSTDNVNTCFLYCIYRTTNISKCRKLVNTLLCSKLIVRCCIYLFDDLWLDKIIPKNNGRRQSHMRISIPVIRLIRFTGQWKIPFLKITIEVVKVTAALYNILLYSLTLTLSEIKKYCNR